MASPVNVRTTTQGSNVRTTLPREGIDIGPLPDFWGDLNRMQTRLRPRAKEQEEDLRPGSSRQLSWARPAPDPLASARQRAELAQLQAIYERAPSKMTYVGTSAGFLSPDENAMTGAQRQMFLPGNAVFAQDPRQWYGGGGGR